MAKNNSLQLARIFRRISQSHAHDCYVCLIINGFNASSKKIKYPNPLSSIIHIPHSDYLPLLTTKADEDLIPSSYQDFSLVENWNKLVCAEDNVFFYLPLIYTYRGSIKSSWYSGLSSGTLSRQTETSRVSGHETRNSPRSSICKIGCATTQMFLASSPSFSPDTTPQIGLFS